MDATYQLARFSGRILRHCAGINHDKMGGFGLLGDLMPGFLKRLSPSFQLRFIKAAAECFKVNFHKDIIGTRRKAKGKRWGFSPFAFRPSPFLITQKTSRRQKWTQLRPQNRLLSHTRQHGEYV